MSPLPSHPHTARRLRPPGLADAAVALAVAGGMLWLFVRAADRLDVQWQWATIGQYLVRYDAETGRWVPNLLLQGLLTTVRLSAWSMVLATVLGTVMGVLGASRRLARRGLATAYVELCRNLPPLVLVIIFYYFIGDQVMPLLDLEARVMALDEPARRFIALVADTPERLSAFVTAVIALAVFEGAYIAEIIRAGIASIETGQWEAARSIGMNRRQTLVRVILPQAVRRILPPLAGQFISTIKDSAIVSVISIQELTFQAMELMAATYLTFEIWLTTAALYFVLTLACSLAVRRLELHLNRHLMP